jgi:glutamate/tyrosine decarboxylase-like PLP-dependent enzyme
MDLDALQQAVTADRAAGRKPFCVVATAGTTNSGVIDDLEGTAEVCRRNNLWLHVDGAYGAAALFSDRHRAALRGVEHADSLTIDPHKWLAVPFAAGVILTSHPEMLQRAFSVAAPYMPKATGAVLPDNSRISTQWTRRMNSLKLWLTLQVHGRVGYQELIDRQMELAQRFAEWLAGSEHFQLAARPTLPIVNFRVKASVRKAMPEAAAHAAVVEAVTKSGERWISETTVNGASVMRMMVISYLTGERQIENLQASLDAAARELH